MTENEAWAHFVGQAFAAGGEHVECRLLSSGPRTNPWFREASNRRVEAGALVSFDTDLVGRRDTWPSSPGPASSGPQRYPFTAHGSGLTDEYPAIVFEDHQKGELEEGMVLGVEACTGVVGEQEGVTLEEQVLVTSEGVELLSQAAHDERLRA